MALWNQTSGIWNAFQICNYTAYACTVCAVLSDLWCTVYLKLLPQALMHSLPHPSLNPIYQFTAFLLFFFYSHSSLYRRVWETTCTQADSLEYTLANRGNIWMRHTHICISEHSATYTNTLCVCSTKCTLAEDNKNDAQGEISREHAHNLYSTLPQEYSQ